MAKDEQGELSKEEVAKRKKEAYAAATSRLREERRTEFDALYSQEAEARGVTYTPKPSAEQQAAEQVADLLNQFPNLKERFVPVDPEVVEPTPVDPVEEPKA